MLDRTGEVVLCPRSRRSHVSRKVKATCPMCGVTYKGKYAGNAVAGCVSYHKRPDKGFLAVKAQNPICVEGVECVKA